MCPMCDSTNVRKDIMAPSVKRKSKQIKGKGQGNLMMSGRARQILQTIEIIKDKIRISEILYAVDEGMNALAQGAGASGANVGSAAQILTDRLWEQLSRGSSGAGTPWRCW